ncbi:unnamed protein product [Acanthoscelides obtectus]|uniref:Uncharacterized protein n=1 Tax=Acanthoscelides obtectus TaxID=200917 RepID=A0A9P0NS15_ACAOB|nr:unnamed protein product [Acanthoscelides obtectus]CAK1625053.1 hypothetical protein AOBTE_LOCUS2913 [Acanthoscelides obtectus]
MTSVWLCHYVTLDIFILSHFSQSINQKSKFSVMKSKNPEDLCPRKNIIRRNGINKSRSGNAFMRSPGTSHMYFKQVCAVCEPMFLSALQDAKRSVRQVIAQHWMDVKDEMTKTFHHKFVEHSCVSCEPILQSEVKKMLRQYQHLLDTKFHEIMELCHNIVTSNLYKKYHFKTIKRRIVYLHCLYLCFVQENLCSS